MIGQWVVRSRPLRLDSEVAGWVPVTLDHLVESTIQDQPVTRCGRRMAPKNSKGELRFRGDALGYLCHFCTTREVSHG